MRRLLNALYDSTAALAALCLVGLLGMVMLSIISRQLGFNVRGIDAYAGYLMAGAGFLALAHTFKKGEHIRVTLLLNRFGERTRRYLEIWCLGAASLLGLLLAYYSCRLAWQWALFNDISTGNDATPLWIPQLGMALGAVVFALAFVDEWVLELLGKRHDSVGGEMLRNE
ncbi:MAG: TRAP transporter small permease [Rhodoferax sp.]|jgi:TRAP-type C4-dicarboxylate transport system permease small subunit|uniref:TRAP transporter small permease n=1 Tax=Rhodoferax sp. TaxID=50421 RepID=UPI001B6876EA|nr:TRAP transporter small permease [Rhodoferax sp.]MBP9735435.1 TRAP transporter small permease [Rhodoferax sp.]